ncbi:DUF6920 family protein [Robiginitalea sediminis]|uniref:DUF6920 family protein n=1 Tax=Robiginitalea sediminis TaxID=1982593 RepID=UPI000B4BF6DB|nr:DUF6544 family protein [Robiginitalea sediminis]
MRFAFTLLVALHGLIHLMGFAKAFGLAELEGLGQPVSRTAGVFWLLAFVLFSLTAVLHYLEVPSWYLAALAGLVISQAVIAMAWTDARFGTIANVLILVGVVLGHAKASFQQQVQQERAELLSQASTPSPQRITETDLQGLPPVVHQWLSRSGVVGKPAVSTVWLRQELQLKLKPGQDSWNPGRAEQVFTVDPPGFVWSIQTEMNAFLPVTGRDRFTGGKGEMHIALGSLIPVARATADPKVDQATLQRYLAEMVWFPSAALSPYITWEPKGENAAMATLSYKGVSGSGTFYFDHQGSFETFTALRYRDASVSQPTPWTVLAKETQVRNGVEIPVRCEVQWKTETGDWTWLQLHIEEIEYNSPGLSKPD